MMQEESPAEASSEEVRREVLAVLMLVAPDMSVLALVTVSRGPLVGVLPKRS